MTKPELTAVFHGMAYQMSDIRQTMSSSEYDAFVQWLDGQTRPGMPGEDLVYIWDYEKWLSGNRRIWD